MSFQEAYDEFKLFAAKRQKKQSFECLNYNFNANILSFFKDDDIFSINATSIFEWQDYILQKNFCNNHNKNLFSMLKSFLEFCHFKYSLNLDFMLEVVPFKPKIEDVKHDFYDLKEFNKFIKCVDHVVYKQFFNLMFFCGTRPGEAMALKFSDLRGDYISINKTIDEHGKRELGTPKTFSSNRLIAIDKKLKKDLLKLYEYYCIKYGSESLDYFIFGGNKPLSPTTINRYKKDACLKANIRPIKLHEFRHSHATLLLNSGISIHDISKRLGHSKISTTLDIYTHSNQEKRVTSTLNSMRSNIFVCLNYNFKNIISLFKHLWKTFFDKKIKY